MKLVYLLFIIYVCSFARENPFLSSNDFTQDSNILANSKENKKEFDAREIFLPSDARVLYKISLQYQSVDGNILHKDVLVGENIDWHNPIIVSQNKPELVQTQETNSSSKIEKKNEIKFKDFLSFNVEKNKIIVKTKDKLLRNFLIPEPYKIVLDFQGDSNFYTKTLDVNYENFKKIRIGNHDKYYRVVIQLDGQYKYNIFENENEVEINLK